MGLSCDRPGPARNRVNLNPAYYLVPILYIIWPHEVLIIINHLIKFNYFILMNLKLIISFYNFKYKSFFDILVIYCPFVNLQLTLNPNPKLRNKQYQKF